MTTFLAAALGLSLLTNAYAVYQLAKRRRPRDARPPKRTGSAGRGPARGCTVPLPPVFDPGRVHRDPTPTERIRRVSDHTHRTARRPM